MAPHPKTPPPVLLRLLALLSGLLCATALQAQPLVDGLTLGGGVAIDQGDLDWNPEDGPVEFLSFGSPSVFAAVDRAFGPVVAEASLQFDRYAIKSELVDLNLFTSSLNLTAGIPINVIRPGFFRLYAGVAPMLVAPTYERVDDRVLNGSAYDFEQQGAHVVWTFPVGVVVQDAIRLGFRFIASDDFDSTTGTTDARDFITFVSIGYRFDLLR